MFTEKQLRRIFPRNQHLGLWLRPLDAACREFGIDTPRQRAHFLAQLAVESAELTKLEESLHYTPRRLVQVWPKRFPTLEDATLYARNPERLANFVYAGRLGNGDEASRDGWRYRGRGALQITGRANYAEIGELLGENLINTPDMLLEPKWAALSAGAFWQRNELNKPADRDDLTAVTKKVNGALNGLKERERYLVTAKEVLGVVNDRRTARSDTAGAVLSQSRKSAAQAEAPGWFD